jgi:hypothetical protein
MSGVATAVSRLIEEQIQHLDNQSFAVFRNWFISYEQARWDRQIEADSENGKLRFSDSRSTRRTPCWNN